MVPSHCVINSWKMGLVVFGVIVCQCGYFTPVNDNPTYVWFLGPLCQILERQVSYFFKATLPLKPATIPLKIGHLAFQDVFLPTFLDATKTKKTASEAQGISSGVAVENLPIFQVAGADAVPHGFMVVLNHPKIMWKIFPPPPLPIKKRCTCLQGAGILKFLWVLC